MKLVRFKREHAMWLAHSPGHESYLPFVSNESSLRAIELAPHSHSIVGENTVFGCLGLAEYWPGRCEAWALMNRGCGRNFFAVHNIVKRYLSTVNVCRIEAAVQLNGFFQAHRWVRALGFKPENECATAYLPGGKDAKIYVRIK